MTGTDTHRERSPRPAAGLGITTPGACRVPGPGEPGPAPLRRGSAHPGSHRTLTLPGRARPPRPSPAAHSLYCAMRCTLPLHVWMMPPKSRGGGGAPGPCGSSGPYDMAGPERAPAPLTAPARAAPARPPRLRAGGGRCEGREERREGAGVSGAHPAPPSDQHCHCNPPNR